MYLEVICILLPLNGEKRYGYISLIEYWSVVMLPSVQ